MFMLSQIKLGLVGLLTIGCMLLQPLSAFAQVPDQAAPEIMVEKPQPPMQNVFFNVLWGSFTGGMLVMGWSTLDDSKTTDERYTVNNLSGQFLTGATYGGLIGLAVSVYLSFQGITFDESRTKIAILQPPKGFEPLSGQNGLPSGILAKDLHLFSVQYEF